VRKIVPGNFLAALVKGGRLLFNRLKEKPVAKVDEYVLEHMLLYHGLIGSSPENQRAFRDVRADVAEAINQRSSVQLGIALKLPPLWWEDKLISIVAELPEGKRKTAVELLAPDDKGGLIAASANPIKHDDWRVRANSAAILAYLHAENVATILGDALGDASAGGRLASCHIAYALGKLRTAEARAQLARYFNADEPWLRVDLAGALALSDFEAVKKLLPELIRNELDMRDYMSVAVAKQHQPGLFLKQEDPAVNACGLLLVLGIIDAAQNSFTDALVFETGVHELIEPIVSQALKDGSVLAIAAALAGLKWAGKYSACERADHLGALALPSSGSAQMPSTEKLSSMLSELNSQATKSAAIKALDSLVKELGSSGANADLFFAMQLAGEFNNTESTEVLLGSLKKDFRLRDAAVDALGVLGLAETADPLIAFARSLVDVQERNEMEKSKQPVVEEDGPASKSYWSVLRALGGIAIESSAEFLVSATSDFAPDKRAQALNSLTAVLDRKPEIRLSRQIDQVLREALLDPAPMMQLAAVAGVARLNRADLIKDLARLIDANENTVSKDAFASLANLWQHGNAAAVKSALTEKLESTRDALKRKRIEQMLADQG
jgi:hypothetical protein